MAIDNQDIQSIKNRFGIIGNSPLLNNAIRVAMQVSQTEMTVLITGESGSGKESFSKIIHQLSQRKHGQFIAINCGAIPEGTIDSELFGHEKGAFTGAVDARKGYFETVNGGTIFLDEIGEMPLGTQARLLRVLENGEFIRVGSSKVQKTDVRVIAATNVNLLQAVQNKTFREDLYYRLNTVPIFVPPLRDRGQDIVMLFKKFAGEFSENYREKPLNLTGEAAQLLMRYRFPGNIRQLKNLVDQISVLESENREISAEKLHTYLPSDELSSVPALFQGGKDNFSERDLLYKVFFDMKKDVTELKKLVLSFMQNGHINGEVLKEHRDLFNNIVTEENNKPMISDTRPVLYEGNANGKENDTIELGKVEEVMQEEDTLSLEKKEKEMIIRALRKNKNRRKHAANDLGISERTLYRKIKQYDIEEN
ncbi:MAG: sigma-54-dependent Fis family transcriptional regulator [Verrucomicrobia bacterium]|nr:sigma-54-dependent Fis family transcriptional regulator [Cytophagales bacterium]